MRTLDILRSFKRGTHSDVLYARLDGVCRAAHAGDLALACDTAAYGIAWAIQTGRLAGSYERRLRAMKPATLAWAIRWVAERATCLGDVPRILIHLCAALEEA